MEDQEDGLVLLCLDWSQIVFFIAPLVTTYVGLLLDELLVLLQQTWLKLDVSGLVHSVNVTEAGSL